MLDSSRSPALAAYGWSTGRHPHLWGWIRPGRARGECRRSWPERARCPAPQRRIPAACLGNPNRGDQCADVRPQQRGPHLGDQPESPHPTTPGWPPRLGREASSPTALWAWLIQTPWQRPATRTPRDCCANTSRKAPTWGIRSAVNRP